MELDPYFREYEKMKPTDEDLNNVKAKIIKHFKENQRGNLDDLEFAGGF